LTVRGFYVVQKQKGVADAMIKAFITMFGVTWNTRAVSRIPLAFMAISTIWRFTSGD
jgi:hypothetical protein